MRYGHSVETGGPQTGGLRLLRDLTPNALAKVCQDPVSLGPHSHHEGSTIRIAIRDWGIHMAIQPMKQRSRRARAGALSLALGVVAAGLATARPAAADTGLTAPTVTSAVFPPSSSQGPFPVIRTPGTFTFSEPAGSGVAEYAYVLNGQLSVGGGNATVAAGPDGTATTPPLRSGQWGTNSLVVEPIDAAGNVGPRTEYDFYLRSTLTPDAYADYDGDGHIDLLSVGADGTIGFSAGQGNGSVAAATNAVPRGPSYSGALISGGGIANGSGFQGVFIFQNGVLTFGNGDGLGDFPYQNQYVVYSPTGTPWPAFTQVVSPGNITGHGKADLIGRVGDKLVLYPALGQNYYDDPVNIAGNGWSGRTVLGVADVTGDGIPDLIARDDVSGKVWLYPGTGGGNFGDKVRIGSGLTAAAYPHVVLKGDVNGDGLPDAWATTAGGGLVLLPGVAGGGFGCPVTESAPGTWSGVTTLG